MGKKNFKNKHQVKWGVKMNTMTLVTGGNITM